jgi:hydroxymethylbilane synthase
MAVFQIGTRGSQLALYQANYTRDRLQAFFPAHRFELAIIKTEGDRDQASSLRQIGGLGVFTKAIEDALLAGEVDIAVHSLKDLPSAMAAGTVLGAVPPRAAVEDVLVTASGTQLTELPQAAQVATGSIRRRSQLLSIRPDLQIIDLRGNIDTRLSKVSEKVVDGIIMARAAIERLQLKQVKYAVFSPATMIPAVGQGAIGIQCRDDDSRTRELLSKLDHHPTRVAVTAERAYLHKLDSGCQFPVGAHARITETGLHLACIVASIDGKKIIKKDRTAPAEEAENLGIALGEAMLSAGAGDILAELAR